MPFPMQPNIKLVNTPQYREGYANSVQVRVNVWDFFLVFGTLQQAAENEVEVQNFQGVYLSPQQAKALMSILRQNVEQYEKTFGEIKLDPKHGAFGNRQLIVTIESKCWIFVSTRHRRRPALHAFLCRTCPAPFPAAPSSLFLG
jgi:hypothetical protein